MSLDNFSTEAWFLIHILGLLISFAILVFFVRLYDRKKAEKVYGPLRGWRSEIVSEES